MYIYIYICIHTYNIYTHMCVYIYIYIYTYIDCSTPARLRRRPASAPSARRACDPQTYVHTHMRCETIRSGPHSSVVRARAQVAEALSSSPADGQRAELKS